MSRSHEGQIVVVTGAGRGIGRAIAERFGAAGAHVVVNDIDGNGAAETAATIEDAGGSAIPVVADISDATQVGEMFDAAIEAFGTVDVLVNNAGLIGPMRHILEADETWFRQIIEVNLIGTWLCCHRAANVMARKGSGVIINMSSGGATRAHRAFTAYDASKGGIEAMTRAMALDLGPYGVRVNALMPGSIDTENHDTEQRALRGVNIPLERIGEPIDMAGPALFLASTDADYITGEVIRVDGGMLAQQRSATVDIYSPSNFPAIEDLD